MHATHVDTVKISIGRYRRMNSRGTFETLPPDNFVSEQLSGKYTSRGRQVTFSNNAEGYCFSYGKVVRYWPARKGL